MPKKEKYDVFVFPHAGGHEGQYFSLKNELHYIEDFHFIDRRDYHNLPNIEWRAYINETTQKISKRLKRKFIFFGHSMGSLIAYEVLRELKHQVSQDHLLIISAFPTPHSRHLQEKEFISKLSDEELLKKISIYGEIHQELKDKKDFLDFFLQNIRNDFSIIESFNAPGKSIAPIDSPLLALAGSHDSIYQIHDIAQWSKYTTSHFQLSILPGDHFYLFNNIEKISQLISKVILSRKH